MGLADGLITGAGLVLGMVIARQPHLAIWVAGYSGGLSAFPGMASGRYQSEHGTGKAAAAVCGLATTAGSILVVLPYLITSGTGALVAALVIAAALCAVVALLREEPGWRAWALSYGITAAAAVLCIAGNLAAR
jgi:VIT1/CCC1 family predicted Fe2+/Mn2+ transporter